MAPANTVALGCRMAINAATMKVSSPTSVARICAANTPLTQPLTQLLCLREQDDYCYDLQGGCRH